ncbi:MAG: hypothetical protein CMJ19_02780 [Phycisphaeraceae bacterium]|nr:hypothetical protein [Phycisphaeraceae bacterium]
MKNNYGVGDIARWKFDKPELPKEWADHIGNPGKSFRMYIDGDPGHGKTEYMMMLSKMTAEYFGKTHVNSVEMGKHEGILESYERNRFEEEVKPGTWMYNNIRDFDEYKDKMRRDRPRVMALDSISYWPLNVKQVQEIHELHPTRGLIFIAYLDHFKSNKPIVHLCDIKIRVKDFIAYPRSRYGGNKPFVISEHMHQEMLRQRRGNKVKGQGALFD